MRVTEVGEPRYSVRELVDEGARDRRARAAIERAPACRSRRRRGSPRRCERRPALSGEQRAMVERLTRDGRVHAGRRRQGRDRQDVRARCGARGVGGVAACRCSGVAVARRAARELEEGAGIPSTSLSAMLHELRGRPFDGLPRGCVVVIDEAGMVPTRALHELAPARSARAGQARAGRRLPAAPGDRGRRRVRRARGSRRERSSCATTGASVAAGSARRSSCCGPGMPRTSIAAYRAHGELTVAPSADQIREALVERLVARRRRASR